MYKLIPSSPLLKCLHKEYDDFYLNGFCNFSPISAFRTVVIFALGRFVSMVANFYNLQCPKEFSIGFKCVECNFYVSCFDVPFFQNIVMIPKRSLLHLEAGNIFSDLFASTFVYQTVSSTDNKR